MRPPHRVAVRFRFEYSDPAASAAGTGKALINDRYAEILLPLLTDLPCKCIEVAAGTEGNYKLDRFVRILRERWSGPGERKSRSRQYNRGKLECFHPQFLPDVKSRLPRQNLMPEITVEATAVMHELITISYTNSSATEPNPRKRRLSVSRVKLL